jgi:AraC-like DNA-binding protein
MPLPLSIKTLNGNPVLFTTGLPEAYSDQELRGAESYHACNEKYGCLMYQQMTNHGYTTWINHFVITKPVEFVVTANVDDLLLHYTIKGKMSYLMNSEEVDTREHYMHLLVANRLCNIMRFDAPGIYVALTVHIPIAKLAEFNDSFPVVQPFLKKISCSDAVMLLTQNMVAHKRIRNIVQDLTERRLLYCAGERYRVQKIGELIIESLDMLSRYMVDKNGLTAIDHEKGEKMEAFLLKHLHHASPPTLKRLAAFAGINEKNLEHIFRCRHQVTIYNFFQNARMQIIYQQLTETMIPLQDISEFFGYTDYSSFSYAVKKKFYFGPRELRKNALQLLMKTSLVI